MEAINQKFSKEERLRSRTMIEQISLQGKSIKSGALRMKWQWQESETPSPFQIAISVPKKKFKRSVDRNRVKRLIREAYRKNKSGLYATLLKHHIQAAGLIIFLGDTLPSYREVERNLNVILQKLEKGIVKGGE